jgi:hypothetical protein
MTVAALLVAAAVAQPVPFFRALLRQSDPFASVQRLADRLRDAHSTSGDDWRRYDGDGYFVELGAYAARRPQKIVIVARHATRAEAAAYAEELFAAFPNAPQPRPPLAIDGPFSYRGAIVIERRPVGVELDLTKAENEWRVTATLIAGGPRLVVPVSR